MLATQDEHARLVTLATAGLASAMSRRAYRLHILAFLRWRAATHAHEPISRLAVQEYVSTLAEAKSSPATINLILSAIRRLVSEAAANGHLDPEVEKSISSIRGVPRHGARLGRWLTLEDARHLLDLPGESPKAIRDRLVLALLLGCALRRQELSTLTWETIQMRDGRWVISDLVGKGNRIRTVAVPAWVRQRLDAWSEASGISAGYVLRAVNRGGKIGAGHLDANAIWTVVRTRALEVGLGELSPHDLRRTCAKLCRKSGGHLEQIQLMLGHSSVRTTELYLGTVQDLEVAVNDNMGL